MMHLTFSRAKEKMKRVVWENWWLELMNQNLILNQKKALNQKLNQSDYSIGKTEILREFKECKKNSRNVERTKKLLNVKAKKKRFFLFNVKRSVRALMLKMRSGSDIDGYHLTLQS